MFLKKLIFWQGKLNKGQTFSESTISRQPSQVYLLGLLNFINFSNFFITASTVCDDLISSQCLRNAQRIVNSAWAVNIWKTNLLLRNFVLYSLLGIYKEITAKLNRPRMNKAWKKGPFFLFFFFIRICCWKSQVFQRKLIQVKSVYLIKMSTQTPLIF